MQSKITEEMVEEFLKSHNEEINEELKQENKYISNFKVKQSEDSEFYIVADPEIRIKASLIEFIISIRKYKMLYEESYLSYCNKIGSCSVYWNVYLSRKYPNLKGLIVRMLNKEIKETTEKKNAEIKQLTDKVNKLQEERSKKIAYYNKIKRYVRSDSDKLLKPDV